MKVSIVGATGYTGAELLRLLHNHPQAEIIHITSESSTGSEIADIYPHLSAIYDKKLISMQEEEKLSESDAVFVGLPHGHAMKLAKKLVPQGIKVIDLGADYRFNDTKVYEKWYKVEHTDQEANSAYGLPELYRSKIKSADIVGNAGCHCTAAILALTPLLKAKLIEPKSIVVDSKSGISGAGRGLKLTSHFTEMYENLTAYSVAGHRHMPEIEEVLSDMAGENTAITFLPHLIPMARGILSTSYSVLKQGVTAEDIDAAFYDLYKDEYFVRLAGRGVSPATKHVRGSNFCNIGWQLDEHTGRVIVMSVIDNLVKGSSGQAVQSLNILFGLDEHTGLTAAPLYP